MASPEASLDVLRAFVAQLDDPRVLAVDPATSSRVDVADDLLVAGAEVLQSRLRDMLDNGEIERLSSVTASAPSAGGSAVVATLRTGEVVRVHLFDFSEAYGQHLLLVGRPQIEAIPRPRASSGDGRRAGTVVFSAMGEVIEADARYVELFGRLEDIVGRRMVDRVHVEDIKVIADAWLRLGDQDDRSALVRVRLRTADERWRWFDLVLQGQADGELVHTVVIEVENARRPVGRRQIDALTGLVDRWSITQEIAGMVGPVAVLHLDLRGFKRINDALGNRGGDEVLRIVAQRIRTVLRDKDAVSRFGGDEFVIVSPGVDTRDALNGLAERLVDAVTGELVLGGSVVALDACVGTAIARPDEPTDHLLSEAALALTEAKLPNGASVRHFDADLSARAARRADLEALLPGLFTSGQLQFHYQPVVRIIELPDDRTAEPRHESMISYEGLLRWHHPDGSIVPPNETIDLFVANNLIPEFTRWTIDQVCEDLRRLQNGLDHPVAVSFNLSADQLVVPNLVERLADTLDTHDLAPQHLIVELTETSRLDATPGANKILAALQHAGHPIALDDFGTGWSTLDHLIDVPASIIKIDRSFVARLPSERTAALVRALVAVADSFGLHVVAEGVETPEQLQSLRDLGIGSVQGWLFGRAIDRDVAVATNRSLRDELIRRLGAP